MDLASSAVKVKKRDPRIDALSARLHKLADNKAADNARDQQSKQGAKYEDTLRRSRFLCFFA